MSKNEWKDLFYELLDEVEQMVGHEEVWQDYKEQAEEIECETHTWVLQINMPNTPTRNYCEECGATEPADPEDVAEQLRLLEEKE